MIITLLFINQSNFRFIEFFKKINFKFIKINERVEQIIKYTMNSYRKDILSHLGLSPCSIKSHDCFEYQEIKFK